MTIADERDLIRQARQGNHHAFGKLVELHMRSAYNLAYRFVNNHDQAEEVAQEAFVRTYQSIRSFRGDSRFGTWLHRIVVNIALNILKQQKRNAESSPAIDEFASRSNGDAFPGENALLTSQLEGALRQLSPLQRKVVILRHIEGQSTREVSKILCCSEGAVKTHLFRGLRKLRQILCFLKEEVAS